MQNTSGSQGNSPSNPTREEQSKGGQHSHQGSNDATKSSNVNENDQRNQGRSGQESAGKSGQPAPSGGNK
jgi:hypothetical protein